MPLTERDIQTLSAKYAWPQAQPNVGPAEWVLDGGGKELVVSRIRKDRPFLIIEIGCFLGSSIRRWLAVSPNVFVIAVDPWEGEWWANYAQTHGRDLLVEQFSRKDGPYLTFLSSLWNSRTRLFPVRGESPEKLYELADLGVRPDLIYFDSDKTGVDIDIAHQLFPNAILTGDDWTWGIEHGYPIRRAVKAFAREHYGYRVVSNRATWLLVHTPIRLSEGLHILTNLTRDFARALRRLAG